MATKDHYFDGAVAMSGAYYRLAPEPLVEGADVYLACRIDGASPCAETVVYKRLEGPEKAYEAKAERKALKALGDHPNVVSLVDEIVLKDQTALFLPSTSSRTSSSTGTPWAGTTGSRQRPFERSPRRSPTPIRRASRTATSSWRTSFSGSTRTAQNRSGGLGRVGPVERLSRREGVRRKRGLHLARDPHDAGRGDVRPLALGHLGARRPLPLHARLLRGPFLRDQQDAHPSKGPWKATERACGPSARTTPSIAATFPRRRRRWSRPCWPPTPKSAPPRRRSSRPFARGAPRGSARPTRPLASARGCPGDRRPEDGKGLRAPREEVLRHRREQDRPLRPDGRDGLRSTRRRRECSTTCGATGKYHGNFDKLRKQSPATIHKKMLQVKASAKEDWANLRSGFWSRWLLWSYPQPGDGQAAHRQALQRGLSRAGAGSAGAGRGRKKKPIDKVAR